MASTTKPQPTIVIVFGGTGDLNRRKIIPAVYNLFSENWLPDDFLLSVPVVPNTQTINSGTNY